VSWSELPSRWYIIAVLRVDLSGVFWRVGVVCGIEGRRIGGQQRCLCVWREERRDEREQEKSKGSRAQGRY